MARENPPLVALVDMAAKMGGVEFSTLYLARELDRASFRCVVICPEAGDLPDHCRAHGVPVEIVTHPRPISTSFRLRGKTIPNPLAWLANATIFLLAAARVAVRLRKLGAALVCTKGMSAHFYGGLAARLARLPCVWHVQDLVSQRVGNLYSRILGNAGRFLTDHLIADGTTIRDQLAPFVGVGRLTVIHNGVDTGQFSPLVDGRGVRAEWGIGEDEVLVGNAARLTPWKGQDHLVAAFAQISAEFPMAKLALVGAPVFDNDAFERKLRRMVSDAGLAGRVVFAGFRWDLPQVLAALDVFVHSSIEKDTSPLTVVSAMSSGKAIISANVAGVAELFGEPPEAMLIPPANAGALADALRRLLNDADCRRALGEAARLRAERTLSLSQFARRCEAVFRQALGD